MIASQNEDQFQLSSEREWIEGEEIDQRVKFKWSKAKRNLKHCKQKIARRKNLKGKNLLGLW